MPYDLVPMTTNTLSRPVRVLIAGGGTGGHLFPGVALAEAIVEAGGSVRFVGTQKGIEARVLPREGWPLSLIDVRGIKGRGVGGLVRGVARLPRALSQSRRIVSEFAPDVVVGVGGYASGPVVMAAALMGLPTAILEQNSVPGVTNRILGRFVDRVFTSFPGADAYFAGTKIVRTGNPIRRDLVRRLGRAAEEADAQAVASSSAGRPLRLFVFGGSQGASAINRAMMRLAPELAEGLGELELWHQTGERDYEAVKQAYARTLPTARVDPFIRDMAEPYGWCDLVVCRAGATSLAELAAVGCPAILVPFPHATDNHQEHNARSLVDAGGAQLQLESELEGSRLVTSIAELAADRSRLAHMRVAMKAAARPQAAAEIRRELAVLAGPAGT